MVITDSNLVWLVLLFIAILVIVRYGQKMNGTFQN